MNERLRELLAGMDGDDAIAIQNLFELVSRSGSNGLAAQEMEEQLEGIRTRIRNIEMRALERRRGGNQNPVCYLCKSKPTTSTQMVRTSSGVPVCEFCIENLYAELQNNRGTP